MPRRRKIEIKASELACFDVLVKELHSRKEFADFDPSSIRVWAYEAYEPTLSTSRGMKPPVVYVSRSSRSPIG